MDLTKQKMEIAVTACLLALTGFLLMVAYQTPANFKVEGMASMDFPKAIFWIQMILCAYILAKGILNYRKMKAELAALAPVVPSADKAVAAGEVPGEEAALKQPFMQREVAITLALIIAYAVCWNIIGFGLSSFLFFVAESIVLDRERPIWQALLLGVIMTAVIYFAFGFVFRVSFPEPLLDLIL